MLQETNFLGDSKNIDSVADAGSTVPSNNNQKCEEILRMKDLITSLTNGLDISHTSFVRNKFIKFVEMYVVYIKKFSEANDSFRTKKEENKEENSYKE